MFSDGLYLPKEAVIKLYARQTDESVELYINEIYLICNKYIRNYLECDRLYLADVTLI